MLRSTLTNLSLLILTCLNVLQILRMNRTIKAISLSNNHLSDIGIEALCEVFYSINFKPHFIS